MRTTLDISDDVLVALKRRAAETQKPLREVIEDALREDLARRDQRYTHGVSDSVIIYAGRGLRPGVNLDSAADLLDAMEGP